MAYTPEQINEIRAKSGLPPLTSKTSNTPTPSEAIVGKYDYLVPKDKKPGIISQIGSNLKNTFTEGANQVAQDIANTGNVADKAGGDTIAKVLAAGSTAGHLAGDIAKTTGGLIGSVIAPFISESIKNKISSAKDGFMNATNILGEKNSETLAKLSKLADENPEIAQSIGDVFNTVTLEGGKKGVNATKTAASDVASSINEAGINQITKVGNAVQTVAEQAPKFAEKASQLLASEPGVQVKTILQETPKSIFDDFLKVAQDASVDPRKPSVFEKVGDAMSDATKQLKSQADSIGAQKSTIIEKANVGLEKFIDAPRKAILKVMQLSDNPLKNQIIEKLKSIKTKLDADNIIDEIQADIYEAGGTNLIAKGSKFEKQLQGIIGEMNGSLKDSLPQAYRDLNLKYAQKIEAVGTLNRALGEVVDGVATRGAGLVKQFFSPAGTKTKELFEFIKKNTGVDLAQQTTVAKFFGELFDDPKIKSLLEGVPTSQKGIIEKILNFTAEKTGAGTRLRESIRKGSVDKARQLTK